MSEAMLQTNQTEVTTLSELAARPKPQTSVARNVEPNNYNGKYPVAIARARYVEFCAANGTIVGPDGDFRKMSLTQLSDELGVSRMTFNRWSREPGHNAAVAERFRELAGGQRTQAVWDSVYLTARAGKPEAQKIWLKNHDPNYIDPAQKVEHDLGAGLSDLVQLMRQKQQRDRPPAPAIEGEFTNAAPSN